MIVHKQGFHKQSANDGRMTDEVVAHTDFIHPVYGYSRFSGNLHVATCADRAMKAYIRRKNAH